MSPEWSAFIPLLLCAISFGIGALMFPGPKAREEHVAEVIELAKYRKTRGAGSPSFRR
jgi:hypothetical protein